MALKLGKVCRIRYTSTTKIIQIMAWIDLDLFYAKFEFGHFGQKSVRFQN